METRYSDRYAQIRQLNVHNRSVCYWRNNLTIKYFKEERGWYVYEDEGSYNGLNTHLRVEIRKECMKRAFRRKEKCLVRLWGSPNHMGICIRMKADLFPKKCCGETDCLKYEFEMNGTIRGLSYVNESAGKKGRRKTENGKRKDCRDNKVRSQKGRAE